MSKKTATLLTSLAFAISLPLTALADSKMDWKACDKEIKEYKCSGSDKEIWTCLEKHDEKLSKTCQGTHEKGDKLFKK